jgi:HlyD family secretion protein
MGVHRRCRSGIGHGGHLVGLAENVLFASPGRVEGLSEATQVGAGADGVLKAVYVKEGQLVTQGEVLGEIDCDDLKATLQTALAEADRARASKARLLRGARIDERKIAGERTAVARATYNRSKSRIEMLRGLYDKQEISRDTYEQAERDFSIAQADLQAAILAQELLAAPPVPEDLALAEAEVSAAEGRVQSVQAQIQKCSIVAPIQGTILKVHAKPGESFSMVTPRPLFSLADASGRRIKAEVDERDVEKLCVGQNVVVQADALGARRLKGRVVSMSAIMAEKDIYTGDPSDKSDRDTLEAVIDIEHDSPLLPIGLRVTVQFLSTKSRNH